MPKFDQHCFQFIYWNLWIWRILHLGLLGLKIKIDSRLNKVFTNPNSDITTIPSPEAKCLTFGVGNKDLLGVFRPI